MPTSPLLRRYIATAAALGYATLSANDHLLWRRPWLDGPSALTRVLEHAGSMTLATSVALPTVRHPVALSKWLSTLGCLVLPAARRPAASSTRSPKVRCHVPA